MRVIRTENLTKAFRGEVVVNKITLEVAQGEIFGFLGRNGAGKSTFINMLTDIMKPTSGEVYLFEENLGIDANKYRIGVLPDYSSFYDDMSAVQHLSYFSRLSGNKASRLKIEETLETVGLWEDRKKKLHTYSFGMKKKLGVAQALIHDPELLILDEPTSGLDAESVIHMQKLIIQLHEQGKTIFMTSHNLDEVEKICTQIAIMKEGEISLQGSLYELQRKFSATFTVRLKTSSELEEVDKKRLKSSLDEAKLSHSWDKNYLFVEVSSEEAIPSLLKRIMMLEVDIYEAEVDQPSLEEIFLEEPDHI
ncbi:ABC transporter ATP-binding protein [Alkalicoccus daliensis]|uniref:ABC-2 type transport system ATP-binding protein n=1 Tax=Alkalicoccus daliensis TaxID=745820 RepID=A0A1H0HS06_9BACI|nr:ABC transporter ATP-binding protein [Alkalicoccus daliensis]SDO21918.1 ABC-2 type transport system ATP-binding protein [Alkalicoccus daliensis]